MDSIVYDKKETYSKSLIDFAEDRFFRSPLLNAEILESFEPLDSWSRVALNRERDKPIRPLAGKYNKHQLNYFLLKKFINWFRSNLLALYITILIIKDVRHLVACLSDGLMNFGLFPPRGFSGVLSWVSQSWTTASGLKIILMMKVCCCCGFSLPDDLDDGTRGCLYLYIYILLFSLFFGGMLKPKVKIE